MTADTTDTTVTLARGRQSLEGQMLAVTASGTRLRARIVRDSYDFQSYAVVEAWTAERGFQSVTSTPISRTRVFAYSYVTRDEAGWREAIGLDLLELIAAAERFLP